MGGIRIGEDLLVGSPEYAHGVGCEFQGCDFMSDLSTDLDVRGEGGLDGISESRKHRTCCRVSERNDENSVLNGAIFRGVGEDVGSVRGSLEGNLRSSCMWLSVL